MEIQKFDGMSSCVQFNHSFLINFKQLIMCIFESETTRNMRFQQASFCTDFSLIHGLLELNVDFSFDFYYDLWRKQKY